VAHERLREQSELLDKAQDAIFVQDMDSRILHWNQGAGNNRDLWNGKLYGYYDVCKGSIGTLRTSSLKSALTGSFTSDIRQREVCL